MFKVVVAVRNSQCVIDWCMLHYQFKFNEIVTEMIQQWSHISLVKPKIDLFKCLYLLQDKHTNSNYDKLAADKKPI